MKIKFKTLIIIIYLIIGLAGCNTKGKLKNNQAEGAELRFVFLTDIHLQPELGATKAFDKVIKTVNQLNPDLVLTGGDMIMDALETPLDRVSQLYELYQKKIEDFNMKVYNTIGNHEIFGWYKKSGVNPSNQLFGKKMFEKKLGKRYYSFDFKNWHFMVIDSIQKIDGDGYIGKIDEQQKNWIQKDLEKISKNTPIIISTHIPFYTVMYQVKKGVLEPLKSSIVITNGKDILDLFQEYNLLLVLQGHLHFYEEIKVNGITFITGGAVSANWWEGPYHGIEEGFLMVKIKDGQIDAQYIDYGWEASEKIE